MFRLPPDEPPRGWPQPPLAVGFSVRALAEALAAWGTPPIAVDHFTDWDCRQRAFSWYQIVDWGGQCDMLLDELSLLAAFRKPSEACVLLGGGTENWLELVAGLHQRFRVLGPSPPQLGLLRDYRFWRWCSHATGIRFPLTRPIPTDSTPPNGQLSGPLGWLCKPLRSAGGLRIRRAAGGRPEVLEKWGGREGASGDAVFQEYIAGRVLGAQCILRPSGSLVLGITEAWNASDWPGPSEFVYRGSWGTIALSQPCQASIKLLCDRVFAHSGLRGWLQLDLIQQANGQLWLLEMNPRWAAGMEILYLAGINPVGWHMAAWQDDSDGWRSPTPPNVAEGGWHQTEAKGGWHQTEADGGWHQAEADGGWHQAEAKGGRHQTEAKGGWHQTAGGGWHQAEVDGGWHQAADKPGGAKGVFGKAVVYADRPLQLTAGALARLHALPRCYYADLPAAELAGSELAAGQPLLTVRSDGPSADDEATARAAMLDRLHRLRAHALRIMHAE